MNDPENRTNKTDMLEAALRYAARDWKIFPLYEPESDGSCSTEAFARSLKVHRATVARQWQKASGVLADAVPAVQMGAELFTTTPDADDERGEWTPEELEADLNGFLSTADAKRLVSKPVCEHRTRLACDTAARR